MPSQTDVKEVGKEGVRDKRKITAADWKTVAEHIADEHRSRKKRRKDREKHWEEIDRQIAMTPDLTFKTLPNGKVDPDKMWMSEMELPLQATALEVLTADARRMMFPGAKSWFGAKAYTTDEYLQKVDFQSFVAGDENEVPSQITQDNANKLVEGFLRNIHRQYDFTGTIDLVNSEAFKYGVGVGRMRMATKRVFLRTAKGIVKENKNLPILFPRSIKNTYLDDTSKKALNEGMMVGDSIIDCFQMKFEDVLLAAKKGSKDPDSQQGGWMPSNLKGIEPDDNGFVEVLEFEGDLIVPRKTTRSLFIPGAIVTAVIGSDGSTHKENVIRFRFRKAPFNTNILFPYHQEDVDSPYAAGPLMKGRPVQIAATNALNRLMDAAALSNAPPIGYEKDDMTFASQGGPVIHPYAKWATLGEIKTYEFANPSAMLEVYLGLLQQYANLTGVNAPRLGQQTVSHTTAFAKDVEQQRGIARTVDYVQTVGQSALTQFLYMEYAMARESMRGEQSFWIDAYDGAVTIRKEHLPEMVDFEWFGAAGPAEEQAKQQSKLSSAQLALSIDQMGIQLGRPPEIQTGDLIKEVLREGGWTDVDAITNSGRAEPAPAVGGVPEVDPSASIDALETLQRG